MPGPIPFMPPVSLASVQQTCARALTAIEYTWPHLTTGFQPSQIDAWSDAVADGDAPQLAQLLNGNGLYGMRHLNTRDLERFQDIALAEPTLRTALIERTTALENAIGVELPLVVPLVASFVSPNVLPKVGLSLFLESLPARVPDAYRGLQIFHLAVEGAAEAASPACTSIARSAGRTPLRVAHFAAQTIDELARRALLPTRVLPLSFPSKVPLTSAEVLIGKFSFLGLLPPVGYRSDDVDALATHEYAADVICIGGLAGYDVDYLDTVFDRLRPSVVIGLTEEESSVENLGAGLMVVLNPEEVTDAYLTLNPAKGTVTAVVGENSVTREHNRRDRLEKRLNARQGAASKELSEKIPAILSRRRKENAEASFRGNMHALRVVTPYAAEYLDAITGGARLSSDYEAKAKLLREVIDRMTAKLPIRESAPHFVQAFATLLKVSGFLAEP